MVRSPSQTTEEAPGYSRESVTLLAGARGLAGVQGGFDFGRIEQEPAAMIVGLALIDERYPSGVCHPVDGAHRHVELCGNLFRAHQSVLSLSHAHHCTAVPYLRSTALEWYNPVVLEWS